MLAEIQAAVDDANKAVSKAEAIKKFRSCRSTSPRRAAQLTPSLKLKRNVVMKDYAAEVDALYSLSRRRSARPPWASMSCRAPVVEVT